MLNSNIGNNINVCKKWALTTCIRIVTFKLIAYKSYSYKTGFGIK